MTPGEPASPYRQVESLNANVPLARFRRTLGPPSSWNYLPDGREYLFITPDYCVQAITDKNGLVVMYAVTALAPDFTPTFGYWGGESWKKVTLGITRFSQVAYPPSITWSLVYADRYSYAEAHWLSGAAGFQTMVVGSNYLGKPTLASWEGMMGINGRVSRSETKRIAPSRRTNVVNTFGMFAPATDMFGSIAPKQFVERGGWLGPTHWDLQSTTHSNGSGASAN